MIMPEKLDEKLLAPCGINCLVCYRYCAGARKPCPGCRYDGEGKPEHCRRCHIRDCAREKGVEHCFLCAEYPCRRLRSMERSYRTRYAFHLTADERFALEHGAQDLAALHGERYRCPECGGVISLHDRICSDCGAPMPGQKEREDRT